MSVHECACTGVCTQSMKLKNISVSYIGQTEDGNNVYSNFNVRTTKSHLDLSEERTKGHF